MAGTELQPGSASNPSFVFLLGHVDVNVYRYRNYNGIISEQDEVGLDPGAGKSMIVFDINNVGMGYLESSVAAALLNLLENYEIDLEGIVKKAPTDRQPDKFYCQIKLYLRKEDFDKVGRAIAGSGVHLKGSKPGEEKQKYAPTEEHVDEIFKNLASKLSKEGESHALEPPKALIKSDLLFHQRQGLSWLVNKERSAELPPFWKEINGLFVNELTNYRTHKRPESIRGGIFADDTGLGKILTFLSLIAYDKNAEGSRIVDNMEPRTTLIICPPSVTLSWITEIEEHTEKGSFDYDKYKGTENTQEVEILKKQDIVFATYSLLGAEEASLISPIKEIEWRRVILDEAHAIKNPNTQQFRAVTNLNAKRRWAVTETSMQNSSYDIFSLVSFLKLEPLHMKDLWTRLIHRPLARGNDKGISRLKVIIAAISLRRTKDEVGFPSKSIETLYVDLRDEERKYYNDMEEGAKEIVKSYMSDFARNYSAFLSILVGLRQICTDISLCSADLRAALLPGRIQDVRNNVTLLRKLLSELPHAEDFICVICHDSRTDIIITCCAHTFCESCITKILKEIKRSCPICRNPLSESDLFKAPPESFQTDSTEGQSRNLSSKVIALQEHLCESRVTNPSSKSVIFTQFIKMLPLLENTLKEVGFKVLCLDTSMNAKKRDQVIRDFSVTVEKGSTILLASLKASDTGINLTAASRVYLLEPWWNPAVEEQALDRVNSIERKDGVQIVRLIVRDTIEERILQLQEEKRGFALIDV